MTAPTPEQISSEPALPQAPKTVATRARAVGKILPGLCCCSGRISLRSLPGQERAEHAAGTRAADG